VFDGAAPPSANTVGQACPSRPL